MKVGIVGLGYVGLPLAVAFAEAGNDVVGVDVNAQRVERLRRSESDVEDVPSDRLRAVAVRFTASDEYRALAACDAVVICVPTPLTDHREPDLSYLIAAAGSLSRVLHEGRGELSVRLEVYVGDDPRRPGLRPDQLVDVAGQILEMPGLRVEGLMTVAPLGGDARAAFGQVRALKRRLGETFPHVHFGVLSMGMSEDYLLAIQEGSTEIRIGTALFGPRRN
jgi:NAD(P)-dependent dehydrogenase (short-subunit alcohol dehydrogenase family)